MATPASFLGVIIAVATFQAFTAVVDGDPRPQGPTKHHPEIPDIASKPIYDAIDELKQLLGAARSAEAHLRSAIDRHSTLLKEVLGANIELPASRLAAGVSEGSSLMGDGALFYACVPWTGAPQVAGAD